MTAKTLTRRHVLRGAGVALALPWLESLAPRRARGQAAAPRRRFVPIYFPLGTPDFWTPTATGAGDAWQLSPILQPLAPVKGRVTVLTNVDQTAYGDTGFVVPGNGLLTGAYLTCVNGKNGTDAMPRLGISIDQRIAKALAGQTPLPSLQVGLSTLDSFCDGSPCAYSRSISWQDASTPLGKLVDPQAVFDRIVGAAPASTSPTATRAAKRRSVLDFVLGDTETLEGRLGQADRARLDQFLTSVRSLESTIAATPNGECVPIARPTLSASVQSTPPGYNRDDHANVMIDLIVMALSCDVTRVVSFMLDDARSDFPYDFLTARVFTDAGSTPGTGSAGGPVGDANSGNTSSMWATIVWWYVTKLSSLCQKLAAIPDGEGATLLDNSLVWFGSGQQGENFSSNLPVLYVGGAGGALQVNQSIAFAPHQRLSNFYLTFLTKVFGIQDTSFGDSNGVVPEILD